VVYYFLENEIKEYKMIVDAQKEKLAQIKEDFKFIKECL
jgi:hypothetical protein